MKTIRSIVILAAFFGCARAAGQAFDELPPGVQHQVKRMAENCVKIGDDFWVMTMDRGHERHVANFERRFDEERWRRKIAPIPELVRLSDHRMGATVDAAIRGEFHDRLQAMYPGAERRRVTISQVTGEGLLAYMHPRSRTGDEPVFLHFGDSPIAGYVDGEIAEVIVVPAGTYEYTTVMGAGSTVVRYDYILPTAEELIRLDVKATPATPDSLHAYIIHHGINVYPSFTPDFDIVDNPVSTTSRTRVGRGVSRSSTSTSSKGMVALRWVVADARVPFMRARSRRDMRPTVEQTGLRDNYHAAVNPE